MRDSLIAMELRHWFAKVINVDMAVFDILGNTNIKDLVERTIERSEYF